MIKSGRFSDKKILLIDKEPKTKNDRTWCFWEKENGFFEEIVYKRWSKLSFLSEDFSEVMDISPYQYKMIRGIEFYNYCFNEINKHQNIEIVYGDLKMAGSHKFGTSIILNDTRYELDGSIIFNSIPKERGQGTIKLLQHFKGWIIESAKEIFDPTKATMMDFRVHQDHGTTFVYVLPFTKTTALVEYTLFTKQLLKPEEYDEALKDYLNNFLNLQDYQIKEEEFGIIPMTNEKLSFHGWGEFNIGTAGGQTKGSSGYTFQFIQKQSQQIAECLANGESLYTILDLPKRFRFYDNTFLNILYKNKLQGKRIFTSLFQKNKPQDVLRFLDNETSLKDELKIISSLPTWPFLKAALKQI
jgi:lycopene beta-cyclase